MALRLRESAAVDRDNRTQQGVQLLRQQELSQQQQVAALASREAAVEARIADVEAREVALPRRANELSSKEKELGFRERSLVEREQAGEETRFKAAELERAQVVLQQQLSKTKSQVEELEGETLVLRSKSVELERSQQELLAANERARAAEAQRDFLTKEFQAHRTKYSQLEMEAARLREGSAANDRVMAALKQARDQTGSLDQHRHQLSEQLREQMAKVAELQFEASQLRERVVEGDRLSHELHAAREKIRAMEQRSSILERERAVAAQQLETELEAARRRIDAIESRRYGGEGTSGYVRRGARVLGM